MVAAPDAARQGSRVTAGEVMTRQAATIAPGASVVEAARTMDRAGTGQLLVTGPDGQLAGIISRGHLLRVLARSDQDMKDEIIRDVLTGYLHTNPALVHIQVTDGVVTLSGEVSAKRRCRLPSGCPAPSTGSSTSMTGSPSPSTTPAGCRPRPDYLSAHRRANVRPSPSLNT